MKKLGIIVLAMIFVMGMSVMVLGAEGDPNDGVSDTVEVKINVSPYATLQMPGDFEINLNEPDSGHTTGEPGDQGISDQQTISFATNTNINMNFKWEWDEDQVIADLPAWPDDDWVISPNIVIVDDNNVFDRAGQFDLGGMEGSLDATQGSHEFDVFLETNWNPENDWFDLRADEYTGTFTVTISK